MRGKENWWLKSCCSAVMICDFNVITVTCYPSKCRQGICMFKELWITEKCSGLNWLRVPVKRAIRDSVTQNSSQPKVNYFQKWNWRVGWIADPRTSSASTFFSWLRTSCWKMNELLQDNLRNCFSMRTVGHKVSMMGFFFCD